MALNNPWGVVCNKTQPNQTKPNLMFLLFAFSRYGAISRCSKILPSIKRSNILVFQFYPALGRCQLNSRFECHDSSSPIIPWDFLSSNFFLMLIKLFLYSRYFFLLNSNSIIYLSRSRKCYSHPTSPLFLPSFSPFI